MRRNKSILVALVVLSLPASWTIGAEDPPVPTTRPFLKNNVLLSHSANKWAELMELHRETYAAVKQQYPNLSVCFTTEVLHYKKLASDARGSDQETQVAELMKHSDLFAMSMYPHMSYDVPRPVPADFFDFARKFGQVNRAR